MKRKREVDDFLGRDVDDSELFEKITRIGDTPNINQQLTELKAMLVATLDSKKDYILDTIFKCITQLTVKTSLYSTVIALVNSEEKGFGEDALEEATKLLGATIRECEWCSAALLVRFICDLANTHMVPGEQIALFLQKLARELSNPPIQRGETYCYLVLAALPWCGKVLSSEAPASFKVLMEEIENYFRRRKCASCGWLYNAGPGCNVDVLDVMWSQVQSFRESDFTVTSTLKPYSAFKDDLEPGPMSRRWVLDFQVPSHEDTFVYWDKPAALHLFYPWDDEKGRQKDISPEELEERGSQLKEEAAQMMHFFNRFRIRPVDRLVIMLYVTDTLYFWNTSREDCVKKLRLLPIKGMPEHLVIEAVLSHLLMVPQAPFSHVYYASIITDLCKLDFKYPVVLAEAIETLYDIVPRMDNEMVDRLSAFFAHVVSNFGYKWFWEDWTGVLETDDIQGGTCKKLFIYEVFSAMLRMSYRERLVDVIPAVFHKFIPEAPKHFFKWDAKRWRDKEPPKYKQVAEAVYTVISSGQYESEEVLLELDRLDWNNEMTLPDKVEVLTHCILVNGIETISHQYQMLEKLKPALEGIIDSAEKGGGDQLVDMQLRLKLIQCCCAFWDNSPQHKVIVINQLLTLRLIEPVNVIQWLFSPGVKSYWERAYPWEVVRMALEGLLSEIMDVFRQLRSLNRDRAKLQREITEDPESFDVADKEKILKKSERRSHNLEQMLREDLVEHLKLVFFELFKGFKDALTNHYKRLDANPEKRGEKLTRDQHVKMERAKAKDYVWHKSAVSHFNEMGRKYLMWLSPWLGELRRRFFAEDDTDPRILAIVEGWTAMACRRWCVSKGFSQVQANVYLRYFLEMTKDDMDDDDDDDR